MSATVPSQGPNAGQVSPSSGPSTLTKKATPPFRVVGNPNVMRPDGFEKMQGQSIFASDISLPGMLWVATKKSPYARALVKRVDVSRAVAAGYTTLTRDDLPSSIRISRMKVITGEGDNVNYAGEVVAAVAAPTEFQAEDALNLIDVEYEPLPNTLTILDALNPNSAQLSPNSNILGAAAGVEAEGTATSTQTRVVRGDVNAGFAKADVIVEDLLYTPVLSHSNMEPRAVVANWSNGKLTVWCSNQGSYGIWTGLAGVFNVPPTSVRVLSGGTNVAGMTQGDKGGMTQEQVIASALSLKARLPVKYFLTRMDNQLSSTKRYPILGYIKIGANKSTGKLTAIQARYLSNPGAYGTSGPAGTLGDVQDAYICPNGLFEGITVMTNLYNMSGAFRDVGETQGHFIMEGPMDQVAEKLAMDPLAFRLLNMQRHDSPTVASQDTGQPYTGVGQPECAQMCAQAFNWQGNWQGWDNWKKQSGKVKIGVGVATGAVNKGAIGPPMTADVIIDSNGNISSYNGTSEHGSGNKAVMAIVEAEVLGVRVMDISLVNMNDTDFCRAAVGQGGSRSARSSGQGATVAAEDAKAKLLAVAATYINQKMNMNVAATDLDTLNKQIFLKSNPSVTVAWTDVLKGTNGIHGIGNDFLPTGTAGNYTNRCFPTAMAKVSVDTETGNIQVLEFATSFDIGRVLYYNGCHGQFVGGFSGAGIGGALYQTELRDPVTGKFINPNFHDDGLATWLDTPDPEKLNVAWNEYVDMWGRWGAKGIGEPSISLVPAVIANAVYNATGVRIKTFPLRPDTVLAALKGQSTAATLPPLTPAASQGTIELI